MTAGTRATRAQVAAAIQVRRVSAPAYCTRTHGDAISCPGVYRGKVSYVPDSGPDAPELPSNAHSVMVGQFSFRLP